MTSDLLRRSCAFALALLTSALPAAVTSRVVNLSSRAVVDSGASVLTAGFVLGGAAPKEVLIRALGPALAAAKLTDTLTRPRIEVFNARGERVLSREGWDPALKATFAQVGAMPLPDGSADAAVRTTLPPGAYSVQISGIESPRGIALVEIYELDGASRLLNLSTRARVEPGNGVLTSGFVMTGSGTRTLLIRAGGPMLTRYGLGEALADPVLTVFNQAGVAVATNDNWEEAGAADITRAAAACSAALYDAGSKDAALLVDVSPGIYSMQVTGGGGTSGVALLEVYDVTAINPEVAASTGKTSVGAYPASALSWAWADVNNRLGPRAEQLNAAAAEDRPTIPGRVSKTPPASYYVRIKPFELGDAAAPDSDYWSDSGQVAYIPNDPATDPGLDRIQTFAYYNKVFAISPRLDWASGKPHSDPQTREPYYTTLNGGAPMQPVAMVRNYAMEQNEELVIYRDGLFAVAGTQTSRAGSERPYPGFKFPANKVPRAVAVTTSNEFALVAVWDTTRHIGQLAVVALEGRYIPFHTWPYMALPNQGSWSDFKLLGYVDLPMAAPDAVAAASNGLWTGPSATGGKALSQIALSDDATRQLVYDGDWQAMVAKAGYAVVSSKADNQVAVVDLTPLFAYARESWLGSAASYQATQAARGAAPAQFPQTFDVNPAIKPRVVWQASVARPTTVLAGQRLDRWSKDRFKAYVAAEDGTIHILDTSSLMQRNSWEYRGALQEIGTVKVGRNPVSLAFARHGASNLPLLPNDSTGAQRQPDSLNNLFYAACRGDRSIDAVVTWQGAGAVYDRIRDTRLGDPVAVSVARRGAIVTVADFAGKKILSYRIGTLKDLRNNVDYPPVDPAYGYEFAGELPLSGSPFLVNSTNVN
jgi:hypothetical protein